MPFKFGLRIPENHLSVHWLMHGPRVASSLQGEREYPLFRHTYRLGESNLRVAIWAVSERPLRSVERHHAIISRLLRLSS